jgi:hypothetical protein
MNGGNFGAGSDFTIVWDGIPNNFPHASIFGFARVAAIRPFSDTGGTSKNPPQVCHPNFCCCGPGLFNVLRVVLVIE